VTTVTGFSKKAFFDEWRKDPTNAKTCLDAQIRGEAIHLMFEEYIKNKPLSEVRDADPAYVRLFDQLLPKLDKINNIIMQETGLWSDRFRVAGRVDCIGEYDGVPSIIDFKGSGKAKRKSYIKNYFEQAATYAVMFDERIGRPIGQVVILITCEDGSVQAFIEPVKGHIKGLASTMKNFWKHHNFDVIQENMRICDENDSRAEAVVSKERTE
jgi:genome maintenance exonuclease 1